MREGLKIVGLGVLAAILFGIAHDMVTAHVCVEYFSIGHRNIFGNTTGPAFAYALYWGVVATWWVGLPLGIAVAIAARLGSWPKLSARTVAYKVGFGIAVLWIAAMLVLALTLAMGRTGPLGLYAPQKDKSRRVSDTFLAVGITHEFSYSAGAMIGVVIATLIVVRRRKLERRRAESH